MKCTDCDKEAVCMWPACDPDIQSFPFCRECVEKRKEGIMKKLYEVSDDHS